MDGQDGKTKMTFFIFSSDFPASSGCGAPGRPGGAGRRCVKLRRSRRNRGGVAGWIGRGGRIGRDKDASGRIKAEKGRDKTRQDRSRSDGTERDATGRNWTGWNRSLPHQSVYGGTDKPQRGDGRAIDERVAPPLPAKAQGAVVPARIHRPPADACLPARQDRGCHRATVPQGRSVAAAGSGCAYPCPAPGRDTPQQPPHRTPPTTKPSRLSHPLAGDSSVHTSPQNGSATVAPMPDPASPSPVSSHESA